MTKSTGNRHPAEDEASVFHDEWEKAKAEAVDNTTRGALRLLAMGVCGLIDDFGTTLSSWAIHKWARLSAARADAIRELEETA